MTLVKSCKVIIREKDPRVKQTGLQPPYSVDWWGTENSFKAMGQH